MRAGEWDARYEAVELLWTAEPNTFLVEEASALPPGSALDLACGEGRNAVWLAERGHEVVGVDFSGVALARARLLAQSRGVEVAWVEADVTRWEPPVESFDLVCVLYLQLTRHELATGLRRAAGAVAAGGMLLVVGHDLLNLSEGVGGPRDADVLLTADSVVAELPELVIERAEPVRRPVETDDGRREAIDTLVRARRQPRDQPESEAELGSSPRR